MNFWKSTIFRFKLWRGRRKAKKIDGQLLTGLGPEDQHKNVVEDKRIRPHINEEGIWTPLFDEEEMKVVFKTKRKETDERADD